MSLILSKPDDSALTGLTLTAERGVPSDHVALKILNSGEQEVVGAYVVLYAEDTPGSGIYVTSGQPAVDERMGRLEITGQNADATPGQEIVLGVVQPMGHLAVALLPTILPGDWILADLWIEQAGSSSGGGAINLKIEVANERTALPLPIGVSMVGNGIDTGRKQPRSFPVEGLEVTATGSPDDELHVAPGKWIIEGEEYEDLDIEDLAFTQADGSAATLSTGESYIAVVTQARTSLSVTKGDKDTAPERPTPPSGELILAWVTVNYNGGGTVVQNSDVDQDLTYGRYRPVAPATGLSVVIHAGEAIIANFAQLRATKGAVALAATSTNRIWLEWTGVVVVTQDDVPPSAGAVKIAVATTDASNVTDLTDTRRYISVFEAGSGTITIHTATDSPSVIGVSDLEVPEGALEDLGAGAARLTFPSDTDLIHKDGSVAFTAAQSMGSHKLTNVTDPSSAQDAATKNYVDGAVVGFTLQQKQSVRVATTVAGTLATSFENGDVVDGVTLATNDRILLKNQASGAANGIYTVNASGSPTRASDADSSGEVTPGMFVFVEEGTVNADTGWLLTTNRTITLGSTALTFQKFTADAGAASTGAETITLASGNNDDVAIVNTGVLFDVIKFTASANADLRGLAAPAFGQVIAFVSIAGGNRIRIKHASTGSLAANRIHCPGSTDFDLTASSEGGLMFYDTESLVWRIVASNIGSSGGGAISVTDGSTTVDPCTDIEFTSGATVTDGGGGLAQVAIAGGGGGTEILWEVGTLQTMMTTELNALASNTASGVGTMYDNGTDLFLYADFVLNVTFGTSPTAEFPVNLFLIPAVDGTNYATADATHLPPNCAKGSFLVFNQTTAQKLVIPGVQIPPCKFKLILENATDQNFPATGSTVEMLPYGEQLT